MENKRDRREYSKKWYQLNREHSLEYSKTLKAKKSRERWRKSKRGKETLRLWRQTPKFKKYKRIQSKKYYYSHKDYYKKYKQSKKYKKNCKKYRESIHRIEYMKKWRKLNKKNINNYRKNYYHSHIEYFKNYRNSNKGKESRKRYDQSPKGKLLRRIDRNNRRLKTKDLTKERIQWVYETNIKKYGTLTCYLCIKPIEFGKDHLEHKTPISRGGDNSKRNLGVSCSSCNFRKHNKTVREFLKFRRQYGNEWQGQDL